MSRVRPPLLLIALLAVPACWTSASPAPPAPVAAPTLPSTRSAGELAAELAAELRSPEDSMSPAHYIDRAIMVLDVDTRTTQVLCDAPALGAAMAWGDLLTDPDRPAPRCIARHAQQFSCIQHGPENHDTLILTFHRGETWSLRGVAIGARRAHDPHLLRAHRATLDDDGVCP